MSNSVDPDDAPILTAEIAARAEIREGDKVIRPATGTLTRMGRDLAQGRGTKTHPAVIPRHRRDARGIPPDSASTLAATPACR
jgi:hypothetical protein